MIKTAHKFKISLFAIFLTIGLVSNAQKLSALQESFCQYLLNNEQYDLLDLKYFAQDSLNYNCTINIEDTLMPNIKNLFLANYPITEKLKEHKKQYYYFSPAQIAIRKRDQNLLDFLKRKQVNIAKLKILDENPLQAEVRLLKDSFYYRKNGLSNINFLIDNDFDPHTIKLTGHRNKFLIRQLTALGFDINTLKLGPYLRDFEELEWLLNQGYDISLAQINQNDRQWIIRDSARLIDFIEKGINIDENKMLLIAQKQNNWQAVDQLLSARANPNIRDEYGRTIIYYALVNKDLKLIKKLINKGAYYKPEKLNFEYSILSKAVETNKANIVKYLLSRNVDPNYPHPLAKQYPLVKAYAIGNDTIIQMLIDHGANFEPLILDQYNYDYFRNSDQDYQLLKKFIGRGLKVNMMVCEEGTFLHKAIIDNNQKLIELLITHIEDINILGANHDTPLTCASKYNRTDLCKKLIAMGADVNHYDSTYHHTAINYAIDNNNMELINALLEKELILETPNKYSHTIYKLIRRKKFKILQMFLEHDYLPSEEMMPNFMDMNNKEMVFRLLQRNYIPSFYTAKRIVDVQDQTLILMMIKNGFDLKSYEDNNADFTLKKYAKKMGYSKEIQFLLNDDS